MFSKWFNKKDEPSAPKPPEIVGLRLGGAFELDDLKLRLIEPKLIVANVARTQLIQAVGAVKLDDSSTVLRYYTDDDGYLQVLLNGGMTEHHIADVKLWYFYDTKSISAERDWINLLESTISRPETSLEQCTYKRVWQGIGDITKPVAMTEQTYHDGSVSSETDQFAMLYERQIENELYEYLMLAGEEKIIANRVDRCMVTSTGFDIQPADINIIG